MADRAARDAWLEELAPDSKADRTAWMVMGQRVPASGFSWWRASLVLILMPAGQLVGLVLLSADAATRVGGVLGICSFLAQSLRRARRGWDRYATRTATPPPA